MGVILLVMVVFRIAILDIETLLYGRNVVHSVFVRSFCLGWGGIILFKDDLHSSKNSQKIYLAKKILKLQKCVIF